MMVQIFLIDRSGNERVIEADPGLSLMRGDP